MYQQSHTAGAVNISDTCTKLSFARGRDRKQCTIIVQSKQLRVQDMEYIRDFMQSLIYRGFRSPSIYKLRQKGTRGEDLMLMLYQEFRTQYDSLSHGHPAKYPPEARVLLDRLCDKGQILEYRHMSPRAKAKYASLKKGWA